MDCTHSFTERFVTIIQNKNRTKTCIASRITVPNPLQFQIYFIWDCYPITKQVLSFCWGHNSLFSLENAILNMGDETISFLMLNNISYVES